MKKLQWSILLFLVLSSCNEKSKKNTQETQKLDVKKSTTNSNQIIKFNEITSKGILLAEKITLLDESLNVIKDISKYNESFVEIIAISERMFKENKDDDGCKEFKYVKVKSKDFEGIINGRFIFEIIESTQNKENDTFQFAVTSFFGIGPFEDDEMTDCIEIAPTILIEKKSGTNSLIKMIKNKHYESNYAYFNLSSDSEIWDEILEIKKVNKNHHLQIKRKWQDGGELLTVEISKNDNEEYLAEILNKRSLN